MSRNGVVGFNILDDNFSRDVSELGISEVALEKRYQRPIKKNVFKEVARGAMVMPTFRSTMPMLRTVEGFYGYGANDDASVYPFVYVTLQNNANLKVTWDEPDITPWSSSPVNHYRILLREMQENFREIFIGKTTDTTREFTIDLSDK